MRTLGNVLWFIFGGFFAGLGWCVAGTIMCITVIGIPVGIQCFKFGTLSFFPFGKEIIYGTRASSLLLNILWLIFGGLELAVAFVGAGVFFCITIIGIPFGKQYFKLAGLALLPFGAEIVYK